MEDLVSGTLLTMYTNGMGSYKQIVLDLIRSLIIWN